MWLIHLVIGDDSYDHDKDASTTTAKRTTVLVQHALENFKHVETQLTTREKVLEENQRKLSNQLDRVTKTDSSALRLLEITHYLQCKEIMDIITKRYNEIMQGPEWTMTEAELLSNITSQLPKGHMLPPVSITVLVEMAHKTLHETDEGLAVDYVFPIVSSDIYEELQMIAIPDMAQQKEDKIAINQVKDLFFKSTEVLSRQALNTS